jgi:segregation and condensation protein B
VLKTLLDKGYLRVVGRRDEPGRPLEYGTTPLFLEMFSLDTLASLPTLKEREDLGAEDPTLEVPSDEGLRMLTDDAYEAAVEE